MGLGAFACSKSNSWIRLALNPALSICQNPNKINTTMKTHEKAVNALLCFICSIVDKSFIIKML